MKFVRNYHILLRSTTLLLPLLLFMDCSSEEGDELQPARLIKAHVYDRDTLDSYPLLSGSGILGWPAVIELVFDKPVLHVSINTVNAQPDEGTPATVWQLEVTRNVWDNLKIGLNLEKNVVTLTITYEDETGVQKKTLDAKLGVYHPPVSLEIDSASVWNNQVDADANRLNREGIMITFSADMDTRPDRTKIEVYSGQTMLNWGIDWTEGDITAVLLPESEDDRLLPGHEYEIHLVDFYSFWGQRGEGLEDGPLVIRFQTASVEPEPPNPK